MKNKFAIWSTPCPICTTGYLLLFEKGHNAQCDKCKTTYESDYEEHPELSTPETEFWITNKIS